MTELQVIDLGYEPPVKRKLLVVDDEPAIQTIIYDTLESDYRILAAHNGREAVERALSFKPDLILMDVMMPDISGYEAVRLLYDNPNTRPIPIIMMTAQNFDTSTIEMIRREPNVKAFLPKPFRPKDIRDILISVLNKK